MYSKILSPIDGSETSNRGMAEAIALAKDQKARLRFLHVIDVFFTTERPHIDFGALIGALREDGTRLADQARGAAQAEGVEADTLIVDANEKRISEVIVDQAALWGASLIVMGTHGRRGVSRLFMGSDAERVVRSSNVPVLLVRGPWEPQR